MPHPLDNAYVQLDGAWNDLNKFKSKVVTFQEQGAYRITHHVDDQTGEELVRLGHNDPPQALARDAGQIVNSLRTALNYLVRQLALHDSPDKTISGTQFPIADTPEQFRGCVKKGWLNGVSADHIEAIERLQPYGVGTRIGRPLKQIRRLSNPDKHDDLNAIASWKFPPRSATAAVNTRPEHFPHRLQAEANRLGINPSPTTEVKVELNVAIRVALSDGSPVVETLEILEATVRQILDAFKLEFKGA